MVTSIYSYAKRVKVPDQQVANMGKSSSFIFSAAVKPLIMDPSKIGQSLDS